MNYFKSIVKNVYDRVLEDDFLQPLTDQDVRRIFLSSNQRKLSSHHDPRKASISEP